MTTFWRACVLGGFPAFFAVLAILWKPVTPSYSGAGPDEQSKVGQVFKVPYRLTDTNHFLVRARINGKGPFNFLVDSGAPALYVATATAHKAGLKPSTGAFWTRIQHLELEGGVLLSDANARIEDPFQLVSMNALGLPGAAIDGILGLTILGRFRLEIDPTQESMTWTLLDYVPPDPPVPHRVNGRTAQEPRELQALSALGPLAKGLALLLGKQPEEKPLLHGLLGFEWSEKQTSAGRTCVHVTTVLQGSPADRAGLCAGDCLQRIGGRAVIDLESARTAVANVQAGDRVELTIERSVQAGKDMRQLTILITAAEGF